MKIQPGVQSSSSAISKTFSLTQGKTYLLELSASSTQDNQNFDVTVRLNSGPNWDVLGLNQSIVADPKWKKYAMTFVATQTTTNARLDLMIRKRTGIDESVSVDNVSLREVTVEYNDPINAARIIVNDTAAQATVACPDAGSSRCNEYIDLNGNAVSWPISLSSYSSKIIVWKNNPFKDLTPPTVPGNLRTTAVASSQIDLAWDASTDEKLNVIGYHIYRNGNQVATIAGTSYADSGLSPFTTYVYTVAAYNTAGNISARSNEISRATLTAGLPPVTTPTVTTPVEPIVDTNIPIATTTVPVLISTTTPLVSATTTPDMVKVIAPQRPPLFTKNLFLDMQDDEVRKLQEFLSKDPLIYPEARITGYYGPATKAAVGRFQEKYQLGSPDSVGYGGVGPKTREKLEQVFNSETTITATPTMSTLFKSNLRVGSRGGEVEVLQRLLAQDTKLYPEGLITGYYGRATKAAVGRLQEKYQLGTPATPGYGGVGPKTRAVLNSLVK